MHSIKRSGVMKPKGIVILGVIYTIMALLYLFGVTKGLNALTYRNIYVLTDRNIIINLVFSFVIIGGFLYSGIQVLSLNYSGAYSAYAICTLRVFEFIRYSFLYPPKNINS